jgi:Flp pilus assembly protein TadB
MGWGPVRLSSRSSRCGSTAAGAGCCVVMMLLLLLLLVVVVGVEGVGIILARVVELTRHRRCVTMMMVLPAC